MHARTARKAVALTAMILLAVPASAGAGAASGARSISGESPFIEACTPQSSDAGRRHMEAEPSLAVNPADPDNMAVAWIQDWFDGIVVGTTNDGGENWYKVLPPNFNYCSGGGGFDSALNPHLSFGPDGTLYLTSYLLDSHSPIFGVSVTTSRDGGLTWSPPRLLDRSIFPERVLDWSWVVADPLRPGTAHASWLSLEFNGFALSRMAMLMSTTTDGGQTWSTPREISPTPPGYGRGPTRVVALPDGTLVNVFGQIEICPAAPGCLGQQEVTAMAATSTDGGVTWSQPVTIASLGPFHGSSDEDISRLDTPQADLPAVGPDGSVYFSWSRFDADGASRVMLTRSRDGGRTWSKPRAALSSGGPLMNPNISVAADGTLGLLFYDFRNDVEGDSEVTADVWLARSRGGHHWVETHLAGPFDSGSIPGCPDDHIIPGGCDDDIGSYQGIAGTAEGFVTAFTAARRLATAGPTDIFFAKA